MKKIAHLSIVLLYATSLTSAVFAGRADTSPDTSDVSAIPQQPDVSTETPTPDASADNQDDTTQNNQQNNSKSFNQGVAIGVAAGAAGAAVLGGTFAVKKIREKNKEINDKDQRFSNTEKYVNFARVKINDIHDQIFSGKNDSPKPDPASRNIQHLANLAFHKTVKGNETEARWYLLEMHNFVIPDNKDSQHYNQLKHAYVEHIHKFLPKEL